MFRSRVSAALCALRVSAVAFVLAHSVNASDDLLYGVVWSVSSGPSTFRVKTRGGDYTVEWGSPSRAIEQQVKPLGEVAMGTHVHVLARYQEPQPASGGGQFPATFSAVGAIVAAPSEGFVPPPVPHDLKERGAKWHQGTLQRREKALFVEGTQLTVGTDRPVFAFKSSVSKDSVAKKSAVLVRGQILDPKKKTFRAREVIVLAPQVKAREYRAIIDPSGQHWPLPGRDGKQKPPKGQRPDF